MPPHCLSLQRFYVLGEARSLSTYGIRAEVLLHGQARTHSYGAPSGRPSLFPWMSSLPSYIQMGSPAGAQLATSRILEAQPHPENVNFVV